MDNTTIDSLEGELGSLLDCEDSWDKEEKLRSLAIRISRIAWNTYGAAAAELRGSALREANRVAETLMTAERKG